MKAAAVWFSLACVALALAIISANHDFPLGAVVGGIGFGAGLVEAFVAIEERKP